MQSKAWLQKGPEQGGEEEKGGCMLAEEMSGGCGERRGVEDEKAGGRGEMKRERIHNE